MRLIDSPRSTTDIDYIFVPYKSKKDIRAQVSAVLNEIDGANVEIEMHSKMLRAQLQVDDAVIQLEAYVAMECRGIPMSTGQFARQLGQPPRVVRIMSPDWALAHKLAAWNERRLLRDLYDVFFFIARLGELPADEILAQRLANVESKIPKLSRTKEMTHAKLALELRNEVRDLSDTRLMSELGGAMPVEELAGLALRMKAAIIKLSEWLEDRG